MMGRKHGEKIPFQPSVGTNKKKNPTVLTRRGITNVLARGPIFFEFPATGRKWPAFEHQYSMGAQTGTGNWLHLENTLLIPGFGYRDRNSLVYLPLAQIHDPCFRIPVLYGGGTFNQRTFNPRNGKCPTSNCCP